LYSFSLSVMKCVTVRCGRVADGGGSAAVGRISD